jgi:hypothetical protein
VQSASEIDTVTVAREAGTPPVGVQKSFKKPLKQAVKTLFIQLNDC